MTTRATVALGVLALVLCGCAADRDDARPRALASTGGPSGAATADSDPAAAYLGWLQSLENHDAAASCRAQAPEFVIELRKQAVLQHRAALGDPCSDFVAVLWEDPARQYDPVKIETTYLTDERATVAATFEDGDETADLVHDDAAWRVLHVGRRAEQGATSTGADPARWLRAWCTLDARMSRHELVAAMGPPSGEYTVADGGEPQLWWALDQYDFRVYLDVDGSVLELVGDYDALSRADRQLLPCAELRD